MLRRERGQVTAEYVGVLLLVAAIVGALVVAGPAQRIAGETARNVCRIAGGDCGAAAPAPTVDRQALQRAAGKLGTVIAGDPDPAAVAAFFAQLDPDVAEALAQERPELVGNLDGAPIRLRYRANAEAIRREIARLRAAGAGDDDARLRKLRELDDPDRHFLLFDPAGDGRAAEVFGDLTSARHVAVVVPGMNNDLNNFTGGDAERVHHQASLFDPDQVATIQWLGYDTPEGASALSSADAEPGAEALPQFVAGIRAQRAERLHWTVIGHSYGSLVTGMAESRQGLEVDETVLVGSPGVGVSSAAELGDGNVWVGLARFDLVGYSGWHGPNPHDRAFGATRFHTGDISGHSSYFNEGSESLRNIGLITAGYLDEVNVNDGRF
jgi:pimeloyl-ACP methyl ester carboxylesterase